MVKFYQSWCGHCMRMAADWNRLAEEAPSDVFIKDVNCGEQSDLCNDNDVQGYPTIKYWINGQEHDYDGSREFDDMHSFVLAELSLPCNFKERENCSEKALKYVQKWEVKSEEERQKELDRLTKIVKEGNNMKADLKKWAMERKRILKNSLFSDEL
jgi:protein disulfide-isomerase A1